MITQGGQISSGMIAGHPFHVRLREKAMLVLEFTLGPWGIGALAAGLTLYADTRVVADSSSGSCYRVETPTGTGFLYCRSPGVATMMVFLNSPEAASPVRAAPPSSPKTFLGLVTYIVFGMVARHSGAQPSTAEWIAAAAGTLGDVLDSLAGRGRS